MVMTLNWRTICLNWSVQIISHTIIYQLNFLQFWKKESLNDSSTCPFINTEKRKMSSTPYFKCSYFNSFITAKSINNNCNATFECLDSLYCIHGKCKCDHEFDYWMGSACTKSMNKVYIRKTRKYQESFKQTLHYHMVNKMDLFIGHRSRII